MSKLRIRAAFAIAVLGVVAACGGKVVVDGVGNVGGGFGGAGGEGGEWSCLGDPPPASELAFCGGSTSGGGSGTQCANQWCDKKGNTYTAICDATTCQCWFNGSVACTCALNVPGNFCVSTPMCCPFLGGID